MTLHPSAATRLGAAAFAFCSLTCAPAWGFTERLAAIPIPAAIHPTLLAACEAWGRHIEDLIEQHRSAGELSQVDIDRAADRFYAAKSFCSLGKLLEALAMFETISLGRVKHTPPQRPLW
jgi:hypothetical protein